MSYGSHRVVFVFIICLALAAGFSRAAAECSANPWADAVVGSSFTTGDSMSVLGAPDSVLADFEEVGTDPGFVTVAFVDDVIVDGAGDDFVIHVFDFPTSESVEAFEVFVSEDGAAFVSLGMVFPTLMMGDLPEALPFDLVGSGLAEITQVMVVGLNVDFLNLGEGVDIDAFEALNCEPAANVDLMVCLDDLDACETELGLCEGDLEICDDGFGACLTDLDESSAGLAEIRRLLALPPGQRESDFSCSGALCEEFQATIRMLVAPPGQNVRRGRGPESANRR